MISPFPRIVLVRHGETEWSRSGQHTGRSDIPLTPAGEDAARGLAPLLHGQRFAEVWSSPSQRAARTCDLAGFADRRRTQPDLAEWDYGAYEGLTTRQIQAQAVGWDIFRDGCPAGESVADIAARADRLVAGLRQAADDMLVFSSAHLLRVLAARWLGLPASHSTHLVLGTASISVLGYDHGLHEPAIHLWNRQATWP